jgi:cytochrome c peroxidase
MRPSAMPDNTLRYLLPPLVACLVACLAAGSWLGSALGQEEPVPEEPPVIPAALDAADAPVPPNLDEFIADLPMAIALGKVLYWDMQAGSDGMTACASCHFHAGADNRMQNALGLPKYPADVNFPGANAIVSAADFPFHVLLDPHRPASETNPVLFDSGEIFGSAGVLRKSFVAVQPSGLDYGRDVPDPVFTQGGANCRQVEPRHTPTTINAVFYDRNFWDGRANRYFNGVNPFGDLDPRARVWRFRNGRPEAVQVLIDNSSLASQAVGPPMSGVEMSWSGRQFPELGRKLLTLPPLAAQTVHPDDSVLGAMANPNGKGLASQYTYAEMIRQAFQPPWWDAPNRLRFTVGRSKYLLMERNVHAVSRRSGWSRQTPSCL